MCAAGTCTTDRCCKYLTCRKHLLLTFTGNCPYHQCQYVSDKLLTFRGQGLKARVHVFWSAYLHCTVWLNVTHDKLVPWTRTQLRRWGCHVAAPTVWNSLPTHLCSPSISCGQFRDAMKSHHLTHAYA